MREILTDKAGRKLTLRRMGVLETMRLFRALGGELSENRPYVSLAIIAASVEMIDGVPVPFPVNASAVESLISKIGDDQIEMIGRAIETDGTEKLIADAGN